MNEYISRYVNYLHGNNRSENTVTAYISDIELCLKAIGKDVKDVTVFDLEDWKVNLIHTVSSASAARKITTVRCFFQYLADRGMIDDNPAKLLTGVKPKSKSKVVPMGDEIRRMMDVAGNQRNEAIIFILASTGMRISELVNITLEQWYERIDNAITITGKGNKDRAIQFSDEAVKLVEAYIKTMRVYGKCDNLFTGNLGNPLNPQCTNDMLKRVAKRAGVANYADITNHYMRAAFATIKSEAGCPIEVLREMMGHTSVTTTQRYIKNTENRAKANMAVVNF